MGRDSVDAEGDLDRLLAMALDRPAQGLAAARALLRDKPSPLAAAVAHQTVGIVLRDFGDISEALSELRLARTMSRAAGDARREADILSTLGAALVMAGQTRRGLATLDDAIRMRPGEPDARLLVRRSHVHWLLGRNAETFADAQRAIVLLRGGPEKVWEARAYSHRAMALQAMGEARQADDDFARCEELFRAAGQQLEYASARQDRGSAAFARGDLPMALTFLDEAQQLVDELEVFEPDLFVTQCQVLLAAGLFRDAALMADEALSRSDRQRGAATWRGELLHVAALAAHATGDLDTAITRSRTALQMFRRQQRPRWAARSELLLIESSYDAGAPSATLARRAARLAGDIESLDPARTAEAHLLAGRAALASARMSRAREHLLIAAANRSTDLRARTASWMARATLAEAEGRWSSMLSACSRGLHVVDAHLETLGATELRAGATAGGGELSKMALRHAIRLQDPRRMLVWSERWRARVLAVPPVRIKGDVDVTRDLSALRTVVLRLEKGEVHGEARSTLEHERRRLEDAVRRRTLRRAGDHARRTEAMTVSGLRDHLKDTDLVELMDVEGQLYAVVVNSKRLQSVHVGPTVIAERALDQALFALRREATRRGNQRLDLAPIGERLQAALLGPAVDLIRRESVVVVPPGRLHAIPWALLPRLRGHAVTVAPSARTWMRAQQVVPPPHRRVALVGGPRLSGADAEIRKLSERYPSAVVLTGGDATADRVLAVMDGAWLVHIAAHGTFRADSPLFSALELDDGPLTVYDLDRLERAPYRVILSSCDSAIGAPTGADELLGAVSAFISLGSAGVVASVVPIDDPSTTTFMVNLHELLPDRTLGHALAGARRTVEHDRRAARTAESFIALGA